MSDASWLDLDDDEDVLWSASPRVTSALMGMLGGSLFAAYNYLIVRNK